MKQISIDTFQQWISEAAHFHLIDVREPFEHEQFNLGGMLMPLNEIVNKTASIPVDEPVVIYCKRGIRSQIAIQRLQQKGSFPNLINLQGGTEAWLNKLKP
jgi:rhodanese-related sulfurtransferase